MNRSIGEIIDVETMRLLQDGFSRVTETGAQIFDLDWNPITCCSGGTEFCNVLTKSSKLGCERCKRSDVNASKEVIKKYTPLLEPLGLTYTSYIVLLALWEKDNVLVKDLGNRLFLDSGTLTPLLKKMEKQNLITRTRSKEDERQVFITLTEEGKAEWSDVLNAKVVGIYSGYYGAQISLKDVKPERLEAFSKMLAGECTIAESERWLNPASDDTTFELKYDAGGVQ